MKRLLFLFSITCFFPLIAIGQSLPLALPILDENLRRNQLLGSTDFSSSTMIRPIYWNNLENDSITFNLKEALIPRRILGRKKSFISVIPIYSSIQVGGVPYPEASVFLQSKGLQSYVSSGLLGQLGPLSIQLQPEFFYSKNLNYFQDMPKSIYTEYLERFGKGGYTRILPGQSSVRLNFGAFSAGVSTENIWWGPGQFNSLLFSNNAFGFDHLTLNTTKPAKTFLGNFEGQIIVGRLEGSSLNTTNIDNLFDDWRYLNGITFSYQPKWVPGFYIGASRVFQQYNSSKGNSFGDIFPIFGGLQKERLLDDFEDPGEFDRAGRDQQLTGFVRYINKKAKAELYFEFGRRDHAFNWREAIINPEHARAYLFGFNKLFSLPNDAAFQLRTEVLQQQESINIIIRYSGISGGANWAGHLPIKHGFTHKGQMLGPGVGPSSNVQTLEGAWVKGLKKLGVRFERLNRHQDIYTKRFNDPSEEGRWVDLSARILADWQFDNLIISANVNFVNSLNYQWQLAPNSTPEYPKGENLFTVHSQVSLIYLFQKKKDK